MGAGASNGLGNLPDPVDEATAMRVLGQCFDRADWETITGGVGSCERSTFITTIRLRDHAPTLRAWLEFWRLDELTEILEDFGEGAEASIRYAFSVIVLYNAVSPADVMSPTDLSELDTKTIQQIGLKTVQKCHWEKAIAHSRYLKLIKFDKPPSPLNLWLESWRLQRLGAGLFALGCDVKEDLVDLDESDVGPLQMRLLEQRRWKQGMKQLLTAIREFDFTDDSKSSVPSLTTWLQSLKLERLRPKLEMLGVIELADLADLDDRELASLGLSKLQLKHWNMGMLQVMAAHKQAALDGKNDDPSFRTWLESWRLTRLQPIMEELGAYVRQDLLDLEPNEYQFLKMKSLEAKRFEQAMIALEEEFLTAPEPVPIDVPKRR
jgi:hypothetical protein